MSADVTEVTKNNSESDTTNSNMKMWSGVVRVADSEGTLSE